MSSTTCPGCGESTDPFGAYTRDAGQTWHSACHDEAMGPETGPGESDPACDECKHPVRPAHASVEHTLDRTGERIGIVHEACLPGFVGERKGQTMTRKDGEAYDWRQADEVMRAVLQEQAETTTFDLDAERARDLAQQPG